jgi:hypothetical protein
VPETTVPASASFSGSTVQVPLGAAVGVHAQPFQSGSERDSSATLTFMADPPGILGIAPSTPSDFSFVFFGIAPGTTTVTYAVNGTAAGLNATVIGPDAGM